MKNAEGQVQQGTIRTSALEREEARDLLLELLRCQANRPSSKRLERISGRQWEEIIRQAVEYRAMGLLYRRLKGISPNSSIPAEVMGSLRRLYLLSASRNMRMYAILGKVLRKLQESQIEVIVLKGAFLAEVVYGDIALRVMDDLDLLVQPQDVVRTQEILLGLGLTADEKSNREFSQKTSHHAYGLAEAHVFVEIHWSIDESPSPFKIDVEGLWQRAQNACIAGVPVKALCPEDLVLHICVHISSRHLFADHGLLAMYDLAETTRHYGSAIDWGQLQARARRWGACEPVFLALQLAERLAAAPVPNSVLGELEPDDLDSRAIGLGEKRILANAGVQTPVSENWGRLHASRSMRDKFFALLQTLFPPPELLSTMYSVPSGSRCVYLYYPVRLRHLLQRQARVVWQFVKADRQTRAWVEEEGSRVELEMMKKRTLRGSDKKNE